MRLKLNRIARQVSFVGLATLFSLGAASGQEADKSPAREKQGAAAEASQDYTVGPGDVLSITVVDAPEFGGKFRVSDSGMLDIPGVANSIHADGKSSIELSRTVRQALIDAKQLRNPKVSVFVEEYRGRTITVLGAVSKPAVYPLQKRVNLVEALSLAGGVLPGAGNTVTIIRGPASAEATNTPEGSVQIIPTGRLLKGEDLSANVEVRNGDVLNVSAAQVIYVVGAVVKPGGFVMPDPGTGVSVVQALSLAEGFTPTASSHHAIIVRQSTSDSLRKEIPVDLGQMQRGKLTDVVLAPNDILYVPQSGAKITLQVMTQVAMAAATGVAYYGLGYRVATIH
jgi:polysaccharide export outer membrane protein